jgi:leucyl aminopeptidase
VSFLALQPGFPPVAYRAVTPDLRGLFVTEFKFSTPDGAFKADVLAMGVFVGGQFSEAARAFDEAANGALQHAINGLRFSGKAGEMFKLPAFSEHPSILLFGLGEGDKLDASAIERAAAGVYRAVSSTGHENLAIRLDLPGVDPEMQARAALGVAMAAYRFDGYRTKLTDDKKPSLTRVTFVVGDEKATKKLWEKRFSHVAAGNALARDLVNEPPNILHPESFAERCRKLEALGCAVTVLGEKDMKKLGMGSLLGVGQGSIRESQLVVMEWKGTEKADAPIAFVGKGVCFDTGGISLKPGPGMEEMKGDMGGAAAVTGVMHALAARKAKTHAIGVIGLVENMPDGNAQRPGDIVTSMSGQTIEIHNTDAEGRLVLADALWYTQDRFKPKAMIDLATLTGAIVISLANEYAGLFASDDGLAALIVEAGKAVDEPVWRMPMGPAFDRMIDSPVADMKNIGGREGGSITAAQFLRRFTNDVPWAHLDIASTGWKSKREDPREPSWATGFGVRLLDELVARTYEK